MLLFVGISRTPPIKMDKNCHISVFPRTQHYKRSGLTNVEERMHALHAGDPGSIPGGGKEICHRGGLYVAGPNQPREENE